MLQVFKEEFSNILKKIMHVKTVNFIIGWGMVHDQDCTTNGDGPDPYSMCKFPFLNSGILISDCISITSPSGSNKACERISKQVMKTHGKFPPDGYSRVCIL